MGSKLDVYNAYEEMAWSNPPASMIEALSKYFADDFQSFDQGGTVVMDKKAYIGMVHLLLTAFKDFKAVVSDRSEVSEGVIVSSHFEGTHTSDLDLSAMGIGVVPASGKKIVWPETRNLFEINNDKIVSIKPLDESGGMNSFLEPLGVKLQAA